MPTYTYSARDMGGKTIQGIVEAPNTSSAVRLLRSKQMFVVNIHEVKARFNVATLLARFQRVKFGDIVNFTRQLSTMIVAGLSLPDSLTILRAQTTSPVFARMIGDVEHQIVGGGNLADSLSKYPDTFPAIYIALIRAGESSGTLDKVLVRLAETLEAQREFRSKVAGAMIYPIIIVVGMIIVVMIMMTVVIPKLTDMYRDFGMTLPASTQFLINVSQFFVGFWWLVIIGVFAAFFGFEQWKKTRFGMYTVDKLVLKIPLFGELQKKILLVEFTRTLAMLIASGIHILNGLQILKDSLGNVLYRDAIQDIASKIEKGFPLGDSFAQFEIFPPIVSQMMKVGEETGKLDDTLTKLSKYFQTESEHLVAGLTTAIEPIIMVFLGLGVGFIVISIITPIYNLTSQFK